VEQFWLRPVSAAVIASAVCGLHFFGMLSVRYIADDANQDACYNRIIRTHENSPNAWDDHQMVVAGVSVLVPTLALLIENMICQELLLAYANLKNPKLSNLLPCGNDLNSDDRNRSISKEFAPGNMEKNLRADSNNGNSDDCNKSISKESTPVDMEGSLLLDIGEAKSSEIMEGSLLLDIGEVKSSETVVAMEEQKRYSLKNPNMMGEMDGVIGKEKEGSSVLLLPQSGSPVESTAKSSDIEVEVFTTEERYFH